MRWSVKQPKRLPHHPRNGDVHCLAANAPTPPHHRLDAWRPKPCCRDRCGSVPFSAAASAQPAPPMRAAPHGGKPWVCKRTAWLSAWIRLPAPPLPRCRCCCCCRPGCTVLEGFRERLLADPSFPVKLSIEIGIGVVMKITAGGRDGGWVAGAWLSAPWTGPGGPGA